MKQFTSDMIKIAFVVSGQIPKVDLLNFNINGPALLTYKEM